MKMIPDQNSISKVPEEQCDFILPIVSFGKFIGAIYCTHDGTMEIADNEGITVGWFCAKHFFEMLRLKSEAMERIQRLHG